MSNFKVFIPFLSILLVQLSKSQENCQNTCRATIVETIPVGVETNGIRHMTTTEAWKHLLEISENSIEIASYYWTLRDDHPTATDGLEIYNGLVDAGTRRNISIKITKNPDSESMPNTDTKDLVQARAAEVLDVDFDRLQGKGILHTKLWIVDRKHFYLGSSNMDWRALTQVKELGILMTDCPCLGQDLGKAFDIYWQLGQEDSEIPPGDQWNSTLIPDYNVTNPMIGDFNGSNYHTYISSAPPNICPPGRTTDLDGIYDLIEKAEEFVHIALMDYFPLIMFDGPLSTYWPDMENKLRSAAIDRKIKIKLMMGYWQNTRKEAEQFLKSFQDINNVYENVDVQIKMYQVPSTDEQAQIPYARVNHNKYVVTDKSLWIGTSNWSGDYFISTGGLSFVTTPQEGGNQNLREQVEAIFNRDWSSQYAKNVTEIYPSREKCSSSSTINISTVLILTSVFLIFLPLLI